MGNQCNKCIGNNDSKTELDPNADDKQRKSIESSKR